MDGLVQKIYRRIHLFPKKLGWVAVLFLLLWRVPLAAQAPSSARPELALYQPDGSVLIHVAIPSGATINSAALELPNGQSIPLETEPAAPLPVTAWLVVDASISMINFAPSLLPILQDLIQEQENIALIFYNSQVNLSADLASYSPAVDGLACLGDALARLAQEPRSMSESRRVLVVGGAQPQPCSQAPNPQALQAVVDVVVLADEIDPLYMEIATSSGGQVRRANLRTMQTHIAAIGALWSQETFALRGQATPPVDDAALRLRLSDDAELLFALPWAAISATASATPMPSPTQPALAVVATATPSATATYTDTPSATATQTATDTPTSTASATATHTDTPTATATQTATDTPTATASATATETPVAVASTTATGDEQTSPVLVFVGAALVGFMVLGGVLLLLRALRGRPRQEEETTDSAVDIDALDESIRLYSIGSLGVTIDKRQGKLSKADELMITELVDDEAFQQTAMHSPAEVVAWLKLEGAAPQTVEVRDEPIRIGRSHTSDLIIPNDPAVSGEHVILEPRADGVWIIALGATNPVMAGGVILQRGQARRLLKKDVIRLSPNTQITFVSRTTTTNPDEPTVMM